MTAAEQFALPKFSAVLRKVSLRLLPFMFLLYIMSYLDRINVSFAGLQMNQELGFDDSVFGLGAGVFFLGYFAFGVPSNLMVARIGARKWISAIMVIWGIISVSMALVRDANSFYVLRLLLGIAEAGFFPGMILYLTYWFPKRERGLAIANFMTAIPVAGIVGGLVGSQLLAMHGIAGLSGWKWLFIITGAPSVLLGLVVLLFLTDRPEHAKWLTESERSVLLAKMDEDRIAADPEVHEQESRGTLHTSIPRTPIRTPFADVIANRAVWIFALIYFCLALGMYGFQLWLPQIIHGFGGLNDSQTALLSAIPPIFQALGMVLIAWNSDRVMERRRHLAGSALIAALGLFASTLAPQNPVLSLAALSVAAFGIWGTVGPFWSLPTATLSPRTAAAGIALINSVGNLGGFAGPYLVGQIKTATHSFSFAMYAMSATLVIAGLLALFTNRSQSDPK